MKSVSIRDALKYVAEHPELSTDELLQVPAWELVAHSLYDIANNPDENVRGSYARANKAREMILKRLVGKRRAGSHPATRGNIEVEFVDLTGGEISGPEADEAEPAG
jgi:hypothetical protein